MNPNDPWPAPAKINRFLHITGQRADGYHTLQTLFQFVEPTDWLRFHITDNPAIERRGGLPGLAPADDLVVRAALALQAASGCRQGAHIEVDKQIPAGGGLGGGSTDAATTLVALNQLWGCHLDQATLLDLALGLGADVPVFVAGKAAWAEGVGEQLAPVAADQPWLLMHNPGVSVATEEIFRDAKLTRNGAHITIRAVEAGVARNDCEPVVRRLYPAVGEALDALRALGPAMLTGTGGCMFAQFDNRASALAAAVRFGESDQVWVCQATNRSSLLDRLDAQQALITGA